MLPKTHDRGLGRRLLPRRAAASAAALLLAGALLGCDVSSPPAAGGGCAPPSGLTPLASCLDAGRNAVVGTAACPGAILTGTDLTGAGAVGAITIQAGARLVIPDSTTSLDTTGIDVSGSLEIGTAECPVTSANQVTIRFLGAKPPKCPQTQTRTNANHPQPKKKSTSSTPYNK